MKDMSSTPFVLRVLTPYTVDRRIDGDPSIKALWEPFKIDREPVTRIPGDPRTVVGVLSTNIIAALPGVLPSKIFPVGGQSRYHIMLVLPVLSDSIFHCNETAYALSTSRIVGLKVVFDDTVCCG